MSASQPTVTVDPIREQLLLNGLSVGVAVSTAMTHASSWYDWIKLGETDADQQAREALALQATKAYGTLPFNVTRADDLALAAAWCVVSA